MQYGEIWEKIIDNDEKSLVCFANGTCVVMTEPSDQLEIQAVELLKAWGPVQPGSSAGDFSAIYLDDYPGWVVTSHHPDILNLRGSG